MSDRETSEIDALSAQQAHANSPSAGFLRRFAAWIYDALVAIAIAMLSSALALGLVATLTAMGWLSLGNAEDHAALLTHSIWYKVYLLTVQVVFFGWFWWRSGQTIGMRAWRLRLQNPDGSRLTIKQVAIRMLTCLLGLGNLWVLVDRKHKRAWHDYVAGTELVTLSKQANQLYYWREL
ncbi:hypothetical protein CWI84_11155 [Idiomarina tyrosinivorans]|uniref:RDD domain-containing protein n=1 Tax=Idiomarina tyrosinivorans TaxID=1445662 RepID=A0A432ZG04_9GAMM|nr:RDD family protein [Idiomarina tyrosinivorans]RUO76907.1 hypothetical protein CWI84_11155 [Idiomarina tyrosinivorans]